MLTPGEAVALLDFPRHFNAGDSLIWQGVRTYLDQIGVTVGYVGTLHHLHPRDIRSHVATGPILINGGGNFGDRWVEQQEYKEKILRQFPDRRIVQLPQTIEFQTMEGLHRAQRAVEAHEDFILMVRDRNELRSTQAKFSGTRVVFAPDMALGNGLLERSDEASVPIVVLKRADSEATQQRVDPAPDLLICDWHWKGRASSIAWRVMRAPEDVARVAPLLSTPSYPLKAWGFDLMAKRNVKEAIRILSSGRAIVTDRLHAMVLSSLLQIPVFAFDNANGKVGALYRDYLHQLPGVTLCASAEEAVERARELVATA